jgi:hypothetical protein
MDKLQNNCLFLLIRTSIKSQESEQLRQSQEPGVRGGIAKIYAWSMSRIWQDGKESERHPREPAWINGVNYEVK